MFYTIYKITNKINNKFYIGMHKTTSLDDGYMGSGRLISRAIKRHGIENFSKEILHVFDNEEDMKNKEKELVVLNEMSYNLCEGGKGGFGYINSNPEKFLTKKRLDALTTISERTEEQVLRWKSSLQLSKQTESYKQKVSEGLKKAHKEGRLSAKHINSKESIEKKKETFKRNGHMQGSKNSQFGTCWITNGIINKKIRSEELKDWVSIGYSKGRRMKGDTNENRFE